MHRVNSGDNNCWGPFKHNLNLTESGGAYITTCYGSGSTSESLSRTRRNEDVHGWEGPSCGTKLYFSSGMKCHHGAMSFYVKEVIKTKRCGLDVLRNTLKYGIAFG